MVLSESEFFAAIFFQANFAGGQPWPARLKNDNL